MPGVAQRVGKGVALLFHDRGTRRGWVVSSTLQPHFTPGKDPLPILQEAEWAPGPFWRCGKSRSHRNSIPDRPAHSQSLYQLSYPAHEVSKLHTKIRFLVSNTCKLATPATCELCIFTNYNVAELTVVDGKRGSGWLTGSRPRRILLALWLSFSQAWARICSACTEVRCAGVGRVWANKNII